LDPRLAAQLRVTALADAEFVDTVYLLALRRDPDPSARERALAKLGDGTLSRAALLRELVEGEEFERVRALDDAVAFARWARENDERPRGLTAPAGLDERVIEIPWTLARYRGEPRVLDVGHAFAEPAYLTGLVAAAPGGVVGADLAEAEVPGVRGVVADVRELPFPQRSFDVAFCISTLEHVGRDNRVYGLAAEEDPEGMRRALRELRRVLAGGGRLLVTVPCGEPEEHNWFVQLDETGWLELFRDGGFLVFEHEVYELGPDGWKSREPGSAEAGLRYRARGPGASAVLCAELHPARLTVRARSLVRAARRR
jgi:SAM-dependent methyltransferase